MMMHVMSCRDSAIQCSDLFIYRMRESSWVEFGFGSDDFHLRKMTITMLLCMGGRLSSIQKQAVGKKLIPRRDSSLPVYSNCIGWLASYLLYR